MGIIVAIGGGELKTKSTLEIDRYIANLAINKAGEKRANALFFPTASHDSLPYFNTFRKTYTSVFNLKCDVALLTKKDIPLSRIEEKIQNADMIYVGGGNTRYLLEVWHKTGVDKMIIDAYNKGVILAGISAGGICWFEEFYSDSDVLEGKSNEYKVLKGLSLIEGIVTPHYKSRYGNFNKLFQESSYKSAVCIEDNGAAVYENGIFIKSLSSGGNVHFLNKDGLK